MPFDDIEFITTNEAFRFNSVKEMRAYATKKDLDLSSLKTSNYVKSVVRKGNDYEITINNSKKVACGIKHKIATMIRSSNPFFELALDDGLVNMEEDEKLVFKSKNPLWVLKQIGDVLLLKRIFA